jgi:hypothetical protein
MPREASVADVRAMARSVPSEFLECRLYGHSWRPLTAHHNKQHKFLYVVQTCSRCATLRHQELSERGHVYAQWYSYVDGYLTGSGRIIGEVRDALRALTLGRVYDVQTNSKLEARSSATREAFDA